MGLRDSRKIVVVISPVLIIDCWINAEEIQQLSSMYSVPEIFNKGIEKCKTTYHPLIVGKFN